VLGVELVSAAHDGVGYVRALKDGNIPGLTQSP
jgi:hypothetical protein